MPCSDGSRPCMLTFLSPAKPGRRRQPAPNTGARSRLRAVTQSMPAATAPPPGVGPAQQDRPAAAGLRIHAPRDDLTLATRRCVRSLLDDVCPENSSLRGKPLQSANRGGSGHHTHRRRIGGDQRFCGWPGGRTPTSAGTGTACRGSHAQPRPGSPKARRQTPPRVA